MPKILFIIFLVCFFCNNKSYSQGTSDEVEVFLIDAYADPESAKTFILMFFTSANVKSKVIIENTYTFPVSNDPSLEHKAEIPLEDMKFFSNIVPFILELEDSLGKIHTSEKYEFELPSDQPIVQEGSNFFTLCLFGGAVFLLPYPVFVHTENEDYFSITKEIPLIFIRSSDLGYPTGYFSIEYSHIFNAPKRNLFRFGYKHLLEIPVLEYVSPGINGFTNFKGFNGISPELSLGLFKIYNVFTLYTRYRYNAKPGETGTEFHELSLGLYSGFFALYF